MLLSLKLLFLINVQVNVFLSRINGERIGFSVLGIFVIDKNTILTVNSLFS